ncbi:MAG: SIMPL domain-containing protein [Candidatus Paceibacterota bacterium]|jgi:hypothetical protein
MENQENKCECKMCQKFGWCPAGKWHKVLGVIILIAVVIFIGRAICGGHGWRGLDNKDVSTIVVSGKGEVVVKPDIATVSFTVTEENLDVGIAQDTVNKTVAKVLTYVKAQGVDEKDLKTTSYNIYPRYEYVNKANQILDCSIYPNCYSGKRVVAGYSVSQGIEIKIRDLTKAGKIVSGLGEFGIKDMSGLNFSVDKQDEITKQARDLAIADARADAEKIAKGLGVKLVKVTAFSESGNYPIYYDRAVMSAAPMMAKDVSEAVLPAGENTITSNVSITYEIK